MEQKNLEGNEKAERISLGILNALNSRGALKCSPLAKALNLGRNGLFGWKSLDPDNSNKISYRSILSGLTKKNFISISTTLSGKDVLSISSQGKLLLGVLQQKYGMQNSSEAVESEGKKRNKLYGISNEDRYLTTKRLMVKFLVDGSKKKHEIENYFGMSHSAMANWKTTKHGNFHRAIRDLVKEGIVVVTTMPESGKEVFTLNLKSFNKPENNDIKTMPPRVFQHHEYEPSEKHSEEPKSTVNTDVKAALKTLVNAVYKHVQSKIYVDNKGTLEKYEQENQELKRRIKDLEGTRVDKDSNMMDSFFDDILE